MKVNQLKFGSILSYLQMGVGVIIGMLYTPVMIRLLGTSEYGLYNTVSSTISMMSVLSLGFNASYIRFYTKYKNKNDKTSINNLNGLFLLIYSIIAIIVLFCGFILSNNLTFVFDEGLTLKEYEVARVLMLLLTINLALSFPMSVFTSIISAHEKFVVLKLLGIGKTVVGPLVTLPLLLMGYRSIAMVTVTVVTSVIVDICYVYYVLVKLEQKFTFGRLEKGLFKGIFVYTGFIAINMIVDQINWNVGKVLLGRYKGTTAVSIYSVGYSLYNYYHQFSTSISSVFTPRIHRLVVENQNNKVKQREVITELFVKVGRIQYLVLALIGTGLIFFGKPFIVNVWAGMEYEDSYVVTVLLVISSSIALIQNTGLEIQRAMNKHQFRSIAYIIMAIVNLSMTVVLSQKYGAIGAAIGTAVSLVLANGLIMNIYYHVKCNIDIIYFWKSIGRLSLGLIIPIVTGVIINIVFDLDKIFYLLLGILIYSCVYILSMCFVGMNSYEKELVSKPLMKLMKRRK